MLYSTVRECGLFCAPGACNLFWGAPVAVLFVPSLNFRSLTAQHMELRWSDVHPRYAKQTLYFPHSLTLHPLLTPHRFIPAYPHALMPLPLHTRTHCVTPHTENVPFPLSVICLLLLAFMHAPPALRAPCALLHSPCLSLLVYAGSSDLPPSLCRTTEHRKEPCGPHCFKHVIKVCPWDTPGTSLSPALFWRNLALFQCMH